MTDTIPMPDWVLLEAAKRCKWVEEQEAQRLRLYEYEHNEAFRALCDMILKHEQPPVDRKLLCAREACSERLGITVEEIAIRAIELWEKGFGK